MQNKKPRRLPLAGLVVIDFGQIFQGPYASLLLAKGGADVIKIEPLHGEPLRRRAAPGKSTTLPFAMLNQNKRAVTLNPEATPRGRELLFEMVRRADVLLGKFLASARWTIWGSGGASCTRSTRGSFTRPAPGSASAGPTATIWRWT